MKRLTGTVSTFLEWTWGFTRISESRIGVVPGTSLDGVNSELNADPRRYVLDYDWLWNNPPHNDGTPAAVRMTVGDGAEGEARPAVEAWLSSLPSIAAGFYGRDGWATRIVQFRPQTAVLEIISGGEDVLEGIDAGTYEAYDQMVRGTDLTVLWEQLPRA